MAWTTPVDYSTGQVITAAIWNNLIGSGGNIDETAPAKVTTAGDLVYGTGANAISRLGVGTANQVLKVNSGATAPEWSAVAATELTAGNDKVFYSNSSGVVTELALGASGTVLTSNGATSAPTFAAAATGSLTLTSAEAITAGMAVYVNSSGEAAKCISDAQAGSIGSVPFTATAYNESWAAQNATGAQYYDDNAGCFVKWGMRYSSSYSPYYQGMRGMAIVSNASDNTYTTGATHDNTSWQSNDSMGSWSQGAWYDKYANVGLVYGMAPSTNYVGVFPATVSGTTISSGSLSELTASAAYGPFGLCVDDLNYSLFFYGNSSGMCVRTLTPSGTGAPTWGAEVVLDSTSMTSTSAFTTASYDPVNKVIVVCWSPQSSYADIKYVAGTISGSTITWGSMGSVAYSGSSGDAVDKPMQLCYRSYDNKWMLLYQISSNLYRTQTGTWSSGTTLTWSEFTASSSGAGYLYFPCQNHVDDGLAKVSVAATDAASTSKPYVYFFTLQAGNYKWDETETKLGAYIGTASSMYYGVSYNPTHKRSLATGFKWASDFAYGIFTPPSGADNTLKAVGIAQSTVGSAASLEVKPLGGQDDNQSGLTAGSVVYIQDDATLGHTLKTQKIGVALDADSIAITAAGSDIS